MPDALFPFRQYLVTIKMMNQQQNKEIRIFMMAKHIEVLVVNLIQLETSNKFRK